MLKRTRPDALRSRHRFAANRCGRDRLQKVAGNGFTEMVVGIRGGSFDSNRNRESDEGSAGLETENPSVKIVIAWIFSLVVAPLIVYLLVRYPIKGGEGF